MICPHSGGKADGALRLVPVRHSGLVLRGARLCVSVW